MYIHTIPFFLFLFFSFPCLGGGYSYLPTYFLFYLQKLTVIITLLWFSILYTRFFVYGYIGSYRFPGRVQISMSMISIMRLMSFFILWAWLLA
ncbi:hypothetical protein DFH27DRAFT_565589 [Peziza echinospora]|nr:hypothetical protein DFH27DRAFT_565589 [Peziza echinospora]